MNKPCIICGEPYSDTFFGRYCIRCRKISFTFCGFGEAADIEGRKIPIKRQKELALEAIDKAVCALELEIIDYQKLINKIKKTQGE